MLNKEYYKDVSVENLIVSKDMETMHIRDFERWLNSEHPVLDDAERRYLRCVVLPFYDDVRNVTKSSIDKDWFYITINIKNKELGIEAETICLPYFNGNKMYSGMRIDKNYTLKELGIFK